jgi:RNA polymerase sigma-70 factor (ECF subfamily)
MTPDNSPSANLIELIARARQGDAAALDSVLGRLRPYLRIIADRDIRPLFRQRFDASDIVQQTCHDATRDFHAFRGTAEAEFHAWVQRILYNNIANQFREHTADKRDVRREQPVAIGDSAISLVWCSLPAGGRRPESRVIHGEAALLLSQALLQLTDSQRTAVQMRFLEGHTLAEIAQYLDISVPSAAGLIERGLQTLKGLIPEDVL